MLNSVRWEVLCNRIERASQADFEFIVRALQQSRRTSSEALAWAVDTLIAYSHELDAPVGPFSDIGQIAKEMRDAAGDFTGWGRELLEGFADRLDATAAPVVVGEDSKRLDWLATQFRTCTVYMSGSSLYKPGSGIQSLIGPDFRSAIDASMTAALSGDGHA